MQFKIILPSGRNSVIEGKSVNKDFGEVCCPSILPPDSKNKKIHLIDPRAIIVSEIGIEYTPRDHLDKMDKKMREWMNQNKDWPLVLFLGR